MSKITPAHLEPLAKAFEAALREGAITLAQAYNFCEVTYDAYLEQKLRDATASKRGPVTPTGNET